MKNIQPTYATFEQAKLLKEKKFITKCRSYYLKGYDYPFEGVDDEYWGDNRFKNWNADVIGIKPFEGFASAPEQWQIVEWLRINHNIDLQDICNYGRLGRTYRMGIIFINKKEEVDTIFLRPIDTPFEFIEFKSPQEAYSAAFDYILNNLI